MNASTKFAGVCAAVFQELVVNGGKHALTITGNTVRFELISTSMYSPDLLIIGELQAKTDQYEEWLEAESRNPEDDYPVRFDYLHVVQPTYMQPEITVATVVDTQAVTAVVGMPFTLTPEQVSRLNELLLDHARYSNPDIKRATRFPVAI